MCEPSDFRSFTLLFPEGIDVSLVCFADESGTHDLSGKQHGSEVAGIAGYLSFREVWWTVNDLWRKTLDSFGVPTFHMRELVTYPGQKPNPASPYFAWSQERKDEFIETLAAILTKYAMGPFGALVYVQDYDRVFSPELKAYFKHPYHFCFQGFIGIILHTLDTFFDERLLPGEKIAFFFDQQEEFEPEALKTFLGLKAREDPNRRLGSIAFVDKREYLPLQAADLIAFRLRKIEARARLGNKLITEGGWDDLLLSNETAHVIYYRAENLQAIQAAFDAGRPPRSTGTTITNL